jgi:hypothetical protein
MNNELGKLGIAVNKVRAIAVDLDPEHRRIVEGLIQEVQGTTCQLDLTQCPKQFIKLLLERADLTTRQRRLAFLFISGGEAVLDTKVSDPLEFHNAIAALTKNDGPNVEFLINGRWYPVQMISEHRRYEGMQWTNLQISPKICDLHEHVNWAIGESFFIDDSGKKIELTVVGMLERLGLRPLETDMGEYIGFVRMAQKVRSKSGFVMSAQNAVVVKHEYSWWQRIEQMQYASPVQPRRVVVESELEANNTQRFGYGSSSPQSEAIELPFVRVFALDIKKYVYSDVRDLEETRFDTKALDRLVLPQDMGALLKDVFTTDMSRLFGDILAGKHGGMVIMAHGPAGVGKTLTAEVFAEYTKRPLYVMELGELGTKLDEVEQNLQRVFLRASRWRAVLLMDEADIFMAKRDQDLERSAIVGVFLRLLDYYPGLFFLTSNRVDVIDPAFKSRITLSLAYPQLNREARLRIWETMLRLAGLKVSDEIDGVPDLDLNGRQIRNLVRLLRVLHPDGSVTSDQIKQVCAFACK